MPAAALETEFDPPDAGEQTGNRHLDHKVAPRSRYTCTWHADAGSTARSENGLKARHLVRDATVGRSEVDVAPPGHARGMATCTDCNREMTVAASCVVKTLVLDDVLYDLALHAPGRRNPAARCGDCGVRPGGYHHLGCDLMRCPRCGGQLISCGCWNDEDDENDE